MRIDLSKYLPAGISWENLRPKITLGLAGSGIWSLGVLIRYWNAREELYEITKTMARVLRPGAVMTPFPMLVQGLPLAGFGFYFAALGVMVGYHYLYHRMGSRSIYLMKRLPNRWELHRRCWGVPLLAALAGMILLAALLGIYYLIYLLCTPAQCLR